MKNVEPINQIREALIKNGLATGESIQKFAHAIEKRGLLFFLFPPHDTQESYRIIWLLAKSDFTAPAIEALAPLFRGKVYENNINLMLSQASCFSESSVSFLSSEHQHLLMEVMRRAGKFMESVYREGYSDLIETLAESGFTTVPAIKAIASLATHMSVKERISFIKALVQGGFTTADKIATFAKLIKSNGGMLFVDKSAASRSDILHVIATVLQCRRALSIPNFVKEGSF